MVRLRIPAELAYVEHCLPGASLSERLELARRHGLALEVAHRAGAQATDTVQTLGHCAQAGVPVVTLQAHGMHEHHPLHPDPGVQVRARVHVEEAIALAAKHGVPRVLTACGFGRYVRQDAFAGCLNFYAGLVGPARAARVRILIELLSPRRAAAMAAPEDLLRLVAELDAPDAIGLALDTGHLADAGRDPVAFLASFPAAVEELQLRGPESRPPAPDFPLRATLRSMRPPPAVVALEHSASIEPASLDLLLGRLRAELA